MSPWFSAGSLLRRIINISENKTMLQTVCLTKSVVMTTLQSNTSELRKERYNSRNKDGAGKHRRSIFEVEIWCCLNTEGEATLWIRCPERQVVGRFGRLPPFYSSFRDIRLWWSIGKIRPRITAMLPGCTVDTRVWVICHSFSSFEDTDLLFFIKRGSIYIHSPIRRGTTLPFSYRIQFRFDGFACRPRFLNVVNHF